MTVWIKPSLSLGRNALVNTSKDALSQRIAAALQTGSLHCEKGALVFLPAREPGAQLLVLPDSAPDRLPEVTIAMGDIELPPVDTRSPPLWLERRAEGADTGEALWDLSIALHDRRIGPNVMSWENARPWISGADKREAGLVLPDGRWIILRDDAARDPQRLIDPPVEVITLAAQDRSGLLDALLAWQPGARGIAATSEQRVRLAFLYRNGDDAERTKALARKVIVTAKGRVTHPAGLFFDPDARKDPVAFLFPGQGSQYRGMLRATLAVHPGLRDWFDALDRYNPANLSPLPSRLLLEDWPDDSPAARSFHGLAGGGYAGLASALAHTDLLTSMGLRPDAMLGHSNGENAAMLAAGVIRTTTRRGQFSVLSHMCGLFSEADDSFGDGADLSEPGGGAGCFALAVPSSMDPSVVDTLLDDTVLMMMDNCPSQKVVWGPVKVLEQRLKTLRKDGILVVRLPLSAPYHTPHFRPIVDRFIKDYGMLDLGAGQVRLYSGFTGAPFPETRDEIIETATRQWSEPVLFRKALKQMYADGIRVFVDVGPGGHLAGFVRDTIGDAPHNALAMDTETRLDGTTILRTLAQMFTLGQLDRIDFGHPNKAAPARRDPARVTAPVAGLTCEKSPKTTPALVQPIVSALPDDPPLPAAQSPKSAMLSAIAAAHFDLMRAQLAQETRIFSSLTQQLRASDAMTDAEPARPAPTVEMTPAALPHEPLAQFGVTDLEIDGGTLSASLCMDPTRQSFLADHAFCKARSVDPVRHGLPVLPLMMSAEIAAAASSQLAGSGWVVTQIENLRGYRWIAADSGQIDLRLVVQSQAGADANARRFSVKMDHSNAQDDSGGGLAVTCEVVLQRAYPAPPVPLPDDMGSPPRNHRDGSPVCTGEEFADRLFHGPSFTSIGAVSGWSETGIALCVTAPTEDRFVIPGLRGPREVPGPLLDSAGQILALHQKHKTTSSFGVFPVFVQSINFYGPRPVAGTPLHVVTQQSTVDGTLIGTLDYRSQGGQVLVRMDGLKMVFIHWPRRFETSFFRGRQEASLVEQLAAPGGVTVRMIRGFDRGFLTTSNRIWLRSLAIACLSEGERDTFRALPPRGPRQEEWLMGRIAVKEAGLCTLPDPMAADLMELSVAQDASGRPSLVQPDGTRVHCSISHCAGAAVGAVAPPGTAVGIDVEPVAAPDDPFQGNTLAFHPSEGAVIDRFGAKAVWCAKEAAAKAIGTGLMGAPTRFRARLRGDQIQIVVASESISITLLEVDTYHVALCNIPEVEAVRLAQRLTLLSKTSDGRVSAHVEHCDNHNQYRQGSV
ncbi:type I polyketide synthase [Meridianimarinicoccus aquatilis]|uniref:4'-phosphopantetheinyl transferase superfamily protein n=1 Tax=Meridianimarinicoccus aquatilis TaxID=2552766 RepID=A0A4R6ARV9_9RHOB|nr:acyltransferase domain-containing protein [Fluviibacterium aquatile]TDL86312.1 4'-phosphopantetheinyl transferase superfamily protein [Fluviibacterium aquatile]